MDEDKKGLEVSLNLDTTPILYTDNITIVANEDGVVLNVCQKIGRRRTRIVSRIGMSRVHAKKFVKELSNLLAITEGKKQSAN